MESEYFFRWHIRDTFVGESSCGGRRGTRIAEIVQDSCSRQSLRRRVAYSLAIVRLILVPVIFLAVYYLYEMGLIVDRIVSVDAPVARLAEHASLEMLDARRAERNYFLLRDPEYLKTNQDSLAEAKQSLEQIHDLAPGEDSATKQALENATYMANGFRMRYH